MTLGSSGLLGHTPTARPWSRRQDGPSDGGVGHGSSSGGSGGGAAKHIFRRGSLSGLPDRRRNSCGSATSNSWERRSSLYTPSGRDLQETPFRSRLRESTLLDSLTYERALTQLAREKTLNSLSTLRTIESHFESVCTSDATAFLTPRRPPPSASCGGGGGGVGAAAAGGGRDAEGKKLFFRLSAISSASSGPAHNVSDVSISDISASNLPRLFSPHDLAKDGSRKSSLYGDTATGKRYSHGRSEMVLVAPLTRTPTPSPRGRGQDGMDALLEERARHYTSDQPRKSEFYMPRPHPSEHGYYKSTSPLDYAGTVQQRGGVFANLKPRPSPNTTPHQRPRGGADEQEPPQNAHTKNSRPPNPHPYAAAPWSSLLYLLFSITSLPSSSVLTSSLFFFLFCFSSSFLSLSQDDATREIDMSEYLETCR